MMLYIIGIAVTLFIAYCMYCSEEEKRIEREQMNEIVEALTNK